MRAYEYRHLVSFEETNLVGNVYYVNHLRWQGRCREMFLREHAPSVLAQLQQGLALATTHCSCEYFSELRAFDEITVRMRLSSMVQNRIEMEFEYWRTNGPGRQGDSTAESEELIARGRQGVACMRREGDRMVPDPIPAELRDALAKYADS
jgi:enediyne core biosynthesis thioesterase